MDRIVMSFHTSIVITVEVTKYTFERLLSFMDSRNMLILVYFAGKTI